MIEHMANKMKNRKSKLVACLTASGLLVSSLSGCGMVGTLQDTSQQVETLKAKTVQLRDDAVSNASSAGISRTSRPRLGGDEIFLRANDALPEIFSKTVTFNTQGSQSFPEALDSLASLIGITVRGTEIVNEASSGQAAAPALGAGAPGIAGTVKMDYNGSLRRLLDEMAARNNLSWRYTNKTNTIQFFRYETRTLSIYLPNGAKTIAANISLAGVSGGGGGGGSSGGSGGSGGGGGGAGGAGNVSVTQNMTVDPWTSILGGVQSILSESGNSSSAAAGNAGNRAAGTSSGSLSVSGPAGRAAANPELGLLTVTARPEAVERIASYITSINNRFSQNVLVDIKVFNLSLDKQASLGFNLNLLYNELSNYGVSVVGAGPLSPATGTPGQLTISSTDNKNYWNGSQAVAKALAQFGDVALQTQGQVLAVNGQPSPIQVANEISYLASTSSTQAANVGTTTTLTPGSKVVGFTANFLPLILGDNRILLQYALQISSLTSLNQISSGPNTIQIPQVSSQSLQQQAFVRDGQAIVLFGFDQSRSTADTSMSVAGASKAARQERQMVVIVIQVNGGSKNV